MQLCRSVAGCQLQCVQCSRVALLAGIGCRHQVAASSKGVLSVCALRSPIVGVDACTKAVTWQSSGRDQQLSTKAAAASADPAIATRKLCLIDGHNLAFRAYYGIFKNPMSALQTDDGIPTTVTFGFVRTLLALVEQEQPDALVVVFDAPGGSLSRRELLPGYKAHRTKPAPEFNVDLANLRVLLHFMRMPTLCMSGYEADDVMAGLAVQAKGSGWRTLLVSADKDLWQVVDDAGGVSVLPPSGTSSKSSRGQSASQYIDEAAVLDTLGVPPHRVPDLKALMGDSSDNIPGLKGIGIKTATQLLQKHGDLDTVFEHAAEEKKGVAAKLAGRQEEAALYKNLATVRPEAAPANFDFDTARLQGFASAEVEPLLRLLQMNSLVKDLTRLQQLLGGAAAADPAHLAALPAALEQIAASAAVLTQGDDGQAEAASGVQQLVLTPEASDLQPAAAASSSSSSNSSAATVLAAEPDGASSSISSGSGDVAACVLDDVLSRVPSVQVVSTRQGLNALVDQLTQQQGLVTWSWPQATPYRPGDQQQQPPALVCCAWQLLPQQPGSQLSVESNASSNTTSISSSSPVSAAPATAAPTAAAPPRRRRRTRLASTVQQPHQPTSDGMDKQQQQQQQVVQQAQPLPGVPQLAVVLAGAQLPPAALLAAFKPLLQSKDHPKCMFESKRAYTELHHQGIHLAGVSSDVLVAGCLPDPRRWLEVLDPERQQAAVLPAMTQHVLHTSLTDMATALQTACASYSAAGGSAPAAVDGGSQLQLQPAVWHAAAEVWATLLLHDAFSVALQRLGDSGQLQRLLNSIEVPLQRVLSAMEANGVRCDKQVLLEQRGKLQAEVDALEQELFSIAGRPFNLDSPKECSAVIFDELGLKGKGVKKTKSGYYSTSMSEIEKLEPSPFKTAFIERSRLSSLLSKYYGNSYIGAINPDCGRIHTTYHQVGIATGRLASSNPNMQNVPAHDERGRMFRAAFTADEGHLLVAADYSQVELRVMAALSGDEALLQAFAEGQDVHAATAREVLGKGPQDALTSEERQLGKRVNFSIVYGAGTRQLAADLGMAPKEAQTFLDNFKAAHPKLYEYKTYCMRSAVARGYTLSATGRRRLYNFSSHGLSSLRGTQDLAQLPDMKELQKLAGRDDVHVLLQATNAPIQGTSADVLKAALIQLHDKLAGPPHHCRLLLTVHDDVLLEVPHHAWPGLQAVVASTMEQALPQYGLSLQADVAAGNTWMDCK